MKIITAKFTDLKQILELQRLAYQREAQLLNDYSIPPLKQTLVEVEAEYQSGIVLKAVDSRGEIIGSVRAQVKSNTVYIGKLMVHPAHRSKGIGMQLLREIEQICPQERYELFTSNKSSDNLRLYERAGYIRYKEVAVSPVMNLVYLEKHTVC